MDTAYAQSAETVLRALEGDRRNGLSEAAVEASRATHGANRLERPKPIGLGQRILEAFREPMTLLLLLAAAIMLGVNLARLWTGGETDFAECAGVAVAILLSVGISVAMEGRSAKAFEALRGIGSDVRPRVLRGGRSVRIPQEELVVGDLVVIGTGDKLTADGRLVESSGLVADESALTGESAPVEKSAEAEVPLSAPVAERPTMLYAGSFVTAGSGLMVVTAVGMHTEFGRIAAALAGQETGRTPLQERLAVLGKWVTLAGITAAGLTFAVRLLQGFLQGGLTWTAVGEAFIASVVLIVACVPEGLPTIVAMSLAINVLRMAKQNALVKKMVACETIGCVTFVCSDKTGTLTENRMTALALVGADGQPCEPSGRLLENILVNSTADLLPEDVRQWAAEAEDRLHRPVSLLMPGAPCPCGNATRCKGRTGTLLREQDLHLAGLGLRAESLSEALAEAFPHLTPRERELLHAWAHRPEPNQPRRPIFQTSLALAFKGNVRWVQRVLGRARADNPALFARLETLRNHRLRRTGAYEVPQG